MSITPGEMLESAEVLIKGASEIDYRNSVSRAYYSAMHEAQTLLPQERPESEFRGSSHDALIASLKAFFRMPTSGRQQGASVAGNLAAMKGARKVADYRLAADVREIDAQVCLRRAHDVFAACAMIRELRAKNRNLDQ